MAPPRKVVRQQLEILLKFVEENRDVARGLTPASPMNNQTTRQKWAIVARKLNAVPGGDNKTHDGWKKYWFEWRHKCKKKASDSRRYQTGANTGRNRFLPFDDLEMRVLELNGQGHLTAAIPPPKVDNSQDDENSSDSDRDQAFRDMSEQAHQEQSKQDLRIKVRQVQNSEDETRITPPPQWALDIEERRVAAEERIAEALASMAEVMRSHEERRTMLDERIADALTTIAGTAQDIGSGMQEALQHLQRLQPLSTGPSLKDVFM